jgi:hypothetical protein
MIIRLRWTPIALAVALLTELSVLPAPPVFAGAVDDPSNCGCGSDAGGGYCWGTLQCFRHLPDPSARADMFVAYTSWYLQVIFSATVNDTSYSCTVTDPNRLPLAQSAIAGLGPYNAFWVWWDSSRTCHQIYITLSIPQAISPSVCDRRVA